MRSSISKLNSSQLNTTNITTLVITVFFVIIIASLTYYYNDVSLSMYTIFGAILVIFSVFLIITKPFVGLVLIFLTGYFNNFLIGLPFIDSGARLIGGIVCIGWFLNYFSRGKTLFYELMHFNKILLTLILCMIISSLLAVDQFASFKVTVKITLYITLVLIIQDLVTDKRKLNILISSIAICAGIASIIGLIQYVLLSSGGNAFGQVIYSQEGEMLRFGGLVGANAYASALMAGIPILTFTTFNYKNSYIKLISFSILIASIFQLGLTIARTRILGFAVFFVIYVVLNFRAKLFTKKHILYLSIFIVILSIIFSSFLINHMTQRSFEFNDNSTNVRYLVFVKAVKVLIDHPLWGIGFNNLQQHRYELGISYIESLTDWRDGHDFVSLIVVSLGFLGSITLFYLFFKTMKFIHVAIRNLRKENDDYLLPLLIIVQSAFISHLLMGSGTAVILERSIWLYIGIAVVTYRWTTLDKVEFKEVYK